MNKSYVIQWKSRVNGRSGKGTKLFELSEAQLLASELNREYPDIEHEIMEANAPNEPVPAFEQRNAGEQPGEGSGLPQMNLSPDHVLASG
jgi:hypothetical protein